MFTKICFALIGLALLAPAVASAQAPSRTQIQRWDQTAIRISVHRFVNLFEQHAKATISDCHPQGQYGRECRVRVRATDTTCRFTDYTEPRMPNMDIWDYWLRGLRCSPR